MCISTLETIGWLLGLRWKEFSWLLAFQVGLWGSWTMWIISNSCGIIGLFSSPTMTRIGWGTVLLECKFLIGIPLGCACHAGTGAWDSCSLVLPDVSWRFCHLVQSSGWSQLSIVRRSHGSTAPGAVFRSHCSPAWGAVSSSQFSRWQVPLWRSYMVPLHGSIVTAVP